MKTKVSISIDEDIIGKLDEYIEDGSFRNKSHVIEFALNKFLKENEK